MFLKNVFLVVCAAFCSLTMYAHKISGRITDMYGQPVNDAYIVQKGTENHTHTNTLGFFTIDSMEVNDQLVISHVSYASQEVTITNIQQRLEIILLDGSTDLETIVLSNDVDNLSNLTKINLQLRPVQSSQELLQTVPGLIIGQHAGGGKAEQLFLRGFDIDHGTDVAIEVDGMPVNMVSHAHGQGYADMHFVIPETINTIDYGLGSYDIGVGNFATAGNVRFRTKNVVSQNSIQTEIGDFNHKRLVALAQVLDTDNVSGYIATEYINTDGPFEAPQNFDRLNLFGKVSVSNNHGSKLNISASHFTSTWDASGQIPERAVRSGLISRFGAIDATEGGTTSRTNLNLNYVKELSDTASLTTQLYYSNYDFLLFSNFTFFLVDPINGDQIRQREQRDMAGLRVNYLKDFKLGTKSSQFTAGVGLRNDRTAGSELSRTANRSTLLESIQLGDVNETNYSVWAGLQVDLGKVRVDAGLRYEQFDFTYKDKLTSPFQTRATQAGVLLPKLKVSYELTKNTNLYFNNGIGTHSNDTRVVLANDVNDILPRSFNTDIGFVTKLADRLIMNGALWHLFLEQEFVYVGDAGIVEPSGKSRRLGFDYGLKYQLTKHLFLDVDANYAHARAIEEESGQDFIPLAPKWTSTGSLSVKDYKGFNAAMRYRYIADRPANEDNSINAAGYFVSDLNLSYDITKSITAGVVIQNLFNTQWNETQFATESRLQNETASVEEIHFTPGTPFFVRGTLQFKF